MDIPAYLGVTGWQGLTWHPVTIIGKTPTKYRVRFEDTVMLPGHRRKEPGDIGLVPQHAVRMSGWNE